MSNITKLGIIAYAVESSNESWGKESQAWFEGFAVAMHENGFITSDELEEVINNLISITKEVTNNENRKG